MGREEASFFAPFFRHFPPVSLQAERVGKT